MASLKEVRGRIVSVNSTQQITKAMKMVAASKLRRAQENIVKIRPYTQKLDEVLHNITSSLGDDTLDNPFNAEREPVKILLVVITSDRGLAGAFNTNIIKAANYFLNNTYKDQAESGNVSLLCIGKKGNDYFTKRKMNVISDYVGSFGNLTFETAKKAAEFVMDEFVNGNFDKVEIIYNEFKNAASQIVIKNQFLPIKHEVVADASAHTNIDYIFEPSKIEIVHQLIPKSLKIQFYKALLESNASEHGARMTAMDKATENAKDLLKELKLTYNRTRQAAITKEILEIVGGAEALNA
jgi:F-type H+-transporting ATPase subunit gamma